MLRDDLLSLFVDPLERLGLDYLVTGSVASMLYGEPRLTNDVDLVLDLTPADASRLRAAFFREGGSSKHARDVRALVSARQSGLDLAALRALAAREGVLGLWKELFGEE